MSDTPRTDELLLRINEGRVYEYDGTIAEHARELERELAEEKRDAEIGRWFLRKTSYTGESDGLQYAFMDKCFGPSSLAPTTLREAIEELMKEEK